MPFDFLKRKKDRSGQPGASVTPGPAQPGIPFDAVTEDWRLVGRMLVDGRLSDALNRREPIAIDEVSWAPIDGSEALAPATGLKSVDPYDLVIVLTGNDSLPEVSDSIRSAHKVHKVSYEVALEVPPYRVVGTVYLYPGAEPGQLLGRAAEMFVPVVDATATIGDRAIGPAGVDVILVNRAYLRGVEQVDARTGERHQKLPGSLGGVNWTDRTR